jgi:hypothetical protein
MTANRAADILSAVAFAKGSIDSARNQAIPLAALQAPLVTCR